MPKVFIPQKNLVINAPKGVNLMNLLLQNGLPVASSCKGEGICSKCFLKISPHSEPNEFEQKTMLRNNVPTDCRLSCQITVLSDLVVEASYW